MTSGPSTKALPDSPMRVRHTTGPPRARTLAAARRRKGQGNGAAARLPSEAMASQAANSARSLRSCGADSLDEAGKDGIGRSGILQQIVCKLGVGQAQQALECAAFVAGELGKIPIERALEQHVELLHATPAVPAQAPLVQCWRSAMSVLISAIAFAGFRSFGHASVQFMMVWQR